MIRRIGAALAFVVLSGCVARTLPPAAVPLKPPPVVTAPVTPGTARLLGVRVGPSVASLPVDSIGARRALAAFRISCPALLRRNDASGLTVSADWQGVCERAAAVAIDGAPAFFADNFETVQVGDGLAFATGYYEPEIAGMRLRQPGFDVPVYALPPDLIRAWPADVPSEQRVGKPPLGRYDETGAFVPYYDREAIVNGALAGRGLEIAWVADPVEFFFLQVQGSGRLVAPDGSVMRIGYAGQNGREYAGIGAILRAQGLIGEGPGQYAGSMHGIMRYIREHPVEGQALMNQNKSWIFFRELTGPGPIGAMGVPVAARATVAADGDYVPIGAPIFLSLDRPEANGLWIAQDTGGAIKGANRFDTFWGAGNEARTIAGGMSGRGTAYLLLPKGVLARWKADAPSQP